MVDDWIGDEVDGELVRELMVGSASGWMVGLARGSMMGLTAQQG